jgi:hypothetical protein
MTRIYQYCHDQTQSPPAVSHSDLLPGSFWVFHDFVKQNQLFLFGSAGREESSTTFINSSLTVSAVTILLSTSFCVLPDHG